MALTISVVLSGIFTTTPALSADKSAAMVLDANTGKVLYARNGDAQRYPASLTKMMTLYMVFDQIKTKRLSLDTRIKMTATAARRPPSKLGLKPGRTIRLKHAIRALITKSANDVAAAVAEHIAGSEAAFARQMTRRARGLGMKSTTFKNASGLTHNGQMTTARDMITLALRLQDDFPEYFHLFSTRSFTYGKKTYRNHNTLLRSMRGVDGIKTGYTRASGFNLVTSMRHGRKHVVAAVFGGKTARARNSRMRSLLYRAMKKASTRKTRKPAPMLIAKSKPTRRAKPRVASRPRTKKPVMARTAQRRPITRTVAAAAPRAPGPRPFKPEKAAAPATMPPVAMARVRPVSVLAPTQRPAAPRTANRRRLPAPARVPNIQQPPPVQFARATTAVQPLPTAPRPQRVTRGRPPSTLNQQAAAMTGSHHYGAGLTRMQNSWGLNGPRPAQRAASGGYQVQVGAFPSMQEAERVTQNIRARAPQMLNAYRSVTIPVVVAGKQLWRARFAGFNSAEASRTCNELRRSNIDCFVARPN